MALDTSHDPLAAGFDRPPRLAPPRIEEALAFDDVLLVPPTPRSFPAVTTPRLTREIRSTSR